MIERLPTPWGLVRLGVAPDHPQLKTVSRAFEKIAARPGFRFLGNVEVGRDVTHEELTSRVRRGGLRRRLADRPAARDPRRGPPGLVGRDGARRLVQRPSRLPAPRVRPLARARGRHRERQRRTRRRADAGADRGGARADRHDGRAIAAIVSSGIREIVVLGRRGPVQAAWTSTELGELGELAGADVVVDPAELELDPVSEAELEAALEHRAAQRRDPARVRRRPSVGQATRRAPPVPRLARRDPRRRARRGRRGRPQPPRGGRARSVRAVPTDEREVIPCGIVFRSVGYRGVGIPGVPFDERRGRMPNDERSRARRGRSPIPGLYCAGWIKRGPTGVIGTNKKDATETVEHLLEDARPGRLPGADGRELDELLVERGVDVVAYAGWEAIDAAERAHGESRVDRASSSAAGTSFSRLRVSLGARRACGRRPHPCCRRATTCVGARRARRP